MVILITLAVLPFIWGIINLIQSKASTDESIKHSRFVYGQLKTIIGLITGIFLTFLYTTVEFFSGHYGFMVALIICWLIVSTCNVIAYVKLGMEEYDRTHPQKTDDDNTDEE